MHYFNFILEDKPWNDTVKINQYLFLGRTLWMMSMSMLPHDDVEDSNKLEILSNLNKNLHNFGSTFMALREFIDMLSQAEEEKQLKYLLATDDYSSAKDLLMKIKDKGGNHDQQELPDDMAKIMFIGLQQHYKKMIFILDDSHNALEDILQRSNLDIVKVWNKLQYVYFDDLIAEERTKLTSWQDRTFWLESLNENKVSILMQKAMMLQTNINSSRHFEDYLRSMEDFSESNKDDIEANIEANLLGKNISTEDKDTDIVDIKWEDIPEENIQIQEEEIDVQEVQKDTHQEDEDTQEDKQGWEWFDDDNRDGSKS